MSDPERIWAGEDAIFTKRWRSDDQLGGTEYVRADLASPQPALAVRAVTDEAVRMAGDTLMRHGLNAPEQVIYQAARAVLEGIALVASPPPSGAVEAHKRLERAGGAMSNILYNLKQDPTLAEALRDRMSECQEEWDAAFSVAPATAEGWRTMEDAPPSHPYEDWRKAVNFAIETDEPQAFLKCWNHGEWDVLDREWPEWGALFPAAPTARGGQG